MGSSPDGSARGRGSSGSSGNVIRAKKKFKKRRTGFRKVASAGFLGSVFSKAPSASRAGASGKPPKKASPKKAPPKARVEEKQVEKKAGGRGSGGTFRGYLGWVKLGAVVLCGVFALLVAFDGWRNADDVYGGVEVGGVGVGGESRIEAERVLARSAAGLPEEVSFVAGEKEVVLSAGELGISVDAERSVNRAYSVGRDGDFTERFEDRVKSAFQMAAVGPEIKYEEEAIRAAFESEAEDADYEFTDTQAELVSITPGRNGVRIEDSFWDGLDRKLMEGDGRIEVPLRSVEPNMTTERAERLRPTELLSSYQTNYFTYDDDPGRVANLQIASEAVNGTFLAPGEVFSFNELAEPLDYEKSKVILQGRVDYADGGGLCQVSSTLYMSANLAGLEMVERHPHHAELPYIRPGFDATVWFAREVGTPLDMKFKNTSQGYLYVQQWVDTTTGNVHAAIYGQPNGVAVNMDSEKVATYKDENRKPVTEWVTYKTVTENGQVTFDGPLHTDTYRYLEEAEDAGTA